jgi:DNA excision repair protein ERCC-2
MSYDIEFNLGVRQLIEFTLESGDIDQRYKSSVRALEGTKIHQKLQKNFSKNENYISEERIETFEVVDGMKFKISGRVDGIWKEEEGIVIEEIKSTKSDLDEIDEKYNLHHWAQVKMYGYMYSKENKLDNIKIKLLYVNVETEETKSFLREYRFEKLKKFCDELLSKYAIWAKKIHKYKSIRDESLRNLDFIYPKYRKGQRNLMVGVYRSIEQKKNILVEAPTGIGKTISTLFPAIKSLSTMKLDKVFYVTAKGIVRKVAEDTLNELFDSGSRVKFLTLTAKDKVCINEETICNPEKCKYAKGHYDRVGEAREDILEHNFAITREKIVEYALKYNVCPFELQLDISLWVDIIIGDYNYIFDPKAYLRRFFEDDERQYVFLVDEVHNLIERSRNMYSFDIKKTSILEVRRVIGKYNKRVYSKISKLNEKMLEFRRELQEEDSLEKIIEVDIEALYYDFFNITIALDKWLQENRINKDYNIVLDFYFKCHDYLRLYEYFDDTYVSRVELEEKNELIYHCQCLDTSKILERMYERACSSVLFSATLKPMRYYKNLLGLNDGLHMQLDSPFDRENINVHVVNSISTYYKERRYYYSEVAKLINDMCKDSMGNYLVFLPSFEYIDELEAYLGKISHDIVIQNRGMKEDERTVFIEGFKKINEERGKLGLAVIGGLFSEGVDFRGEELIGVMVVGVGMPKITYERNVLKEYYEEQYGAGFDYAYIYPGMNKVLQAGGRLIRTETDKGDLYLVDKRYGRVKYYDLLPKHWK